jgi:hypothetical protein
MWGNDCYTSIYVYMFQIGKKEGQVEWYCSIFEVLRASWLRVTVFWDVMLGGLMVPDVLRNVWDLSFNETASHSTRPVFSVLQWSAPCLHPWGVMHIYTWYCLISKVGSWGS